MVTRPATIWVIKRSGLIEKFDVAKLSGAMWRAMCPCGTYSKCHDLAEAIELFLDQTGRTCVSSKVIFEMALRVLARTGADNSAGAMETWNTIRSTSRKKLSVLYNDGRVESWDKSWLDEFTQRSWCVSEIASRVIAAEVERDILALDYSTITKDEIVELLNDRVNQLGLGDAVPLGDSRIVPTKHFQ